MASMSRATCFAVCLLWLVEISHGFALPLGNYEAYYLMQDGNKGATKLPGRGPALTTSDCDTITAVPDAVRQQMGLDAFYTRYVHAYGVPVLASDEPPDAALRRACYVVRFLLSDRRDLRDELHDAHGRVGVIGLLEKTTDIPEHSYLPDWWNTRARGLGGTRDVPISTNSEENLLCYGGKHDPWYEEDIMVHEFTHGIHLIAAKFVDPGWQGRLEAAFARARAANLWANTYAITNSIEYFAEGVQSYFDVEVYRSPSDGIHNDISTRPALMGYDFELYEVVREIFPCQNHIVKRCDDQSETLTKPIPMDCPFARK